MPAALAVRACVFVCLPFLLGAFVLPLFPGQKTSFSARSSFPKTMTRGTLAKDTRDSLWKSKTLTRSFISRQINPCDFSIARLSILYST